MPYRHSPLSQNSWLSSFLFKLAIIPLASLFFGCKEKPHTPDWSSTLEPISSSPSPPASPKKQPTTPSTTSDEIRFISYNVRNWLLMERAHSAQPLPKPDSEKSAVITLLSSHNPTLIGLCEIGKPEDLAEIQSLLNKAGINLPFSHFSGGSDPTRHLGFLSKFPLESTPLPNPLIYSIAGKTYAMQRGILDVTTCINQKTYRFLGVHLKSKRSQAEDDQELMRSQEAHLLRQYIDSILSISPESRLVVYGDLNDTRQSPPVKLIAGPYHAPLGLYPLALKDSQQMTWTHFWESEEVYSRIDYIMVSSSLKAETDHQKSMILCHPLWLTASDHRPLMAVFR